jgi:hypothetical protein
MQTIGESRAHRRRMPRRIRTPQRRGLDEPIFEDEDREVPLGGDDRPESASKSS